MLHKSKKIKVTQKTRDKKYWFISDCHIAHDNVLKLSNRPFNSIFDMEQIIVYNINRVVKPEDVLILVGDICLGKRAEWIRFLSAINTKNIILVRGNHDSWRQIPKDMVLIVVEQMVVRMFGKLFMVSHFPYRCSIWKMLTKRLHLSVLSRRRPKDDGLWLLHGHTHSKTILTKHHPRMFNVGVDANNFKPISDEEIHSIIQSVEGV